MSSSNDIQLSDLQKLSVNYLNCVGQLTAISAMSGNPFGIKMASQHMILIKSILGEEIMKMMESQIKSRKLNRQAEDFYELMVESFEEEDQNGSLED